MEVWENEGGTPRLPDKWDQPFDKQQIQIFRQLVDAHQDEPYTVPWRNINWLWLSQAVAAMEKGL